MTRRLVASGLVLAGVLSVIQGCTKVLEIAESSQVEVCLTQADCGFGLQCLGGQCVSPTGNRGGGDDSADDVFVQLDIDVIVDTSDGLDTEDASDSIGAEVSDTVDVAPSDVSDSSDDDIEADSVEPIDGGDADADSSEPSADAEDSVDTSGSEPDGIDDVDEVDATVDATVDVTEPAPEEQALPGLGELCDGPCEQGFLCLPQTDGTARCDSFQDGVCLPCQVDGDCPSSGAQCLTGLDGERFCGSACVSQSDCAYGFDCDAGQCRPPMNSCSCSAETLGYTLGCSNQGADGLCPGILFCQLNGWSVCSAKPPVEEICDGVDNDCDGFIDEQPFYIENGNALPFGSLCGVGQCEGGEVVCAFDGTATCSTNGLATAEVCADNIDNDCDGIVNESCSSDDWDGDGVSNELDCDPADSATYPGATEPCCLTGGLECDRNCDGQIQACAPCDQDGDGFCPPEDCDDGSNSVYPGAPERCDDGIDQDCASGDVICNPAADLDFDNWIPPADCNEGNPAVHPLAPELCDNLDNDCDGLTDEGNPQAGQPCGTGSEYCQSGQQICTHYPAGASIQCQGAVLFEPERCDGIDNNCNGFTDEIFGELGQPCDGPDQDKCPYGTTICLGNGQGTYCGDESITNILEVCNGGDDDCDGAIDEYVCPLFDLDGDGLTEEQGDCDDLDAGRFPGAAEPCCDPAVGTEGQAACDRNCDGVVIPCAPTDGDADGYSVSQGDCDDTDPKTYPGALEKCGDGVDQDCIGGDLDCDLVTDGDGDGFHNGIDCNDTNASISPWGLEDCDFVDEDCDGLIDEGNPTGKVGSCGPDVPECTPGDWVCVHDSGTQTVQILCITENFQADETCNGLDDDCDGVVDETFFDLGLPCDGPDDDGCENGALVCNATGDGYICGDESSEDLVEICDTIDNDCDGLTDEGVHYNDIPLAGLCDGIGACGPGVVQCTPLGTTTCSSNPNGAFPEPVVEVCNGVDEDCDGLIDEDFMHKGVLMGGVCEGVGACGQGVVECHGLDSAGCSTDPGGSASQATSELCDGSDQDCDGHVDESLGYEDSNCGDQGVCAGGEGDAACVAGQWVCLFDDIAEWQQEETLCDGLDNDCDALVDEGWPVGEPCDGDDSDACANGQWLCAASGDGVLCDFELVEDIVEVCNGLDDDCDGVTDETALFPGDIGCETAGVCALTDAVLVVCAGDGYACDFSAVPKYEADELSCDGRDNDCDGLTDESMSLDGVLLGGPCTGLGICGPGVVQCHQSSGEVICSTEPGGAESEGFSELCNALDDDCDGSVDEGYELDGVPIGGPCSALGQCGQGTLECAPSGDIVCSVGPEGSASLSQLEDCNGLDDDCDGQTDEAFGMDTDLAPCVGPGVCVAAGSVATCVDGTWQCDLPSLSGWQPIENACDELDNDCDGEIDEHQPLKGQPCDGPDADTCPTGTWTCAPTGAGMVCLNETGIAGDEVCDGVDDDCDNFVDEGFTYDGIAIGEFCVGKGVCGIGLVECASGLNAATCSTNPYGSESQAVEEVCANSLDDDCDGVTDESPCQ